MKRTVSVLVVATMGVVATVGLLAGTAHAKGACALLTKKEATEALGFKVVEVEPISETSTKTVGCEYHTKKRFPDVGSPMKLRITVQPLNDDTRAAIEQLAADSDSETVEGVGDRALYTSGNDLVVVSGKRVLQAEVTNVRWENDELDTYIKEPELAAMKTLLENLG